MQVIISLLRRVSATYLVLLLHGVATFKVKHVKI